MYARRWAEDEPLLAQLLTMLEINKRWRTGIFAPPVPVKHQPSAKEQYCIEIASALFSNHSLHREQYSKTPLAFASAIKEKLER